MHIPNGFSQVNLEFSGAALPHGAQVVFGVENNGETALTISTLVSTAVVDSGIMTSLVANCILTNIHVKEGPNSTGNFFDKPVSLAGAWATTEAGAVAPALLVRKSTAVGGHAGRGRSYWPGVPESVVDAGGVLNPTYVGDTQDRLDLFLGGLIDGGIPMVLLHGVAPFIPFFVETYLLDSVVGTQRRRQRR